MAVKIIANYSKRLGLPSYSSHQFSVSVEVEVINPSDIEGEASRLYQTLQTAVDQEIQHTGFVPDAGYGIGEQSEVPTSRTSQASQSTRTTTRSSPSMQRRSSSSDDPPWKASDKQRELILKMVHENHIEDEVQEITQSMFGTSSLPSLNKIQASGLIDELIERYGKKGRREPAGAGRWVGNNSTNGTNGRRHSNDRR